MLAAASRVARPIPRRRETGCRNSTRTWTRRRGCGCAPVRRFRRRCESRRCARPSCPKARPCRRPHRRASVPGAPASPTVRSFMHVALVVDQAVLAMRREGIERHVGDHAQVREFLLDGPDRRLARCRPGFQDSRASRVFFAFGRDRKQRDRGDLQPYQGRAFAQQLVDRQAARCRASRPRAGARRGPRPRKSGKSASPRSSGFPASSGGKTRRGACAACGCLEMNCAPIPVIFECDSYHQLCRRKFASAGRQLGSSSVRQPSP